MTTITRGSLATLDPFITNPRINLRAVHLHLWWRGTRLELVKDGI